MPNPGGFEPSRTLAPKSALQICTSSSRVLGIRMRFLEGENHAFSMVDKP